MSKKVFISYAQLPDTNNQRVAELASSLREAGLYVVFDQGVTFPQGPPEGWPKWMLNQIEQADWVLVVCNEAYYRRFRGKEEPGKGLGALWEGAIIGQELYSQGTLNQRFIPVLLDDEPTSHIPEPLRGATHYRLPADLPNLTAALAVGGVTTPMALDGPKRQAKLLTAFLPIGPYAVLSLGSFLGALLLVSLLLWKAELLASLGLTGNFYYLVLLLLGLTVAGCLFGALRSFAIRSLESVVPIASFVLVILGGFLLPPPVSNFPLTVYVHGGPGFHELVLRDQGSVLLDLGTYRRRAPIEHEGQAYFPEIPASFRGQTVKVWLDADGYELVDPGRRYRLNRTSFYLYVRKKPRRLIGSVQDEVGNQVAGAGIFVEDLVATTNSFGHFNLTIPADILQDELSLQVVAKGYAPWRGSVAPGGNEVTVILVHQP